MERELILNVLEQSGRNMAASARKLGISRASLYRKVKDYSSMSGSSRR
jgi:transcriptional regulator with PAS, ATPase and Fis domain